MIDVHAHYLPASICSDIGSDDPTGISYSEKERVLNFPSGPSRPIPPGLIDLDGRRAWNRERGIDIQVLSPWMDVAGDDLEPAAGAVWARMLNDRVAEDVAGDDTFLAFATLPVMDGAFAAAELVRCVEKLGFAGAAIPTQVGGRNLDEAGLEDLFEAAEGLQVPLFVHPFRVLGSERMKRDFLGNICGNPFETTLAALSLFFAGLFERRPGLKILLSHCGGALPFIAGRAAHAAQAVPSVSRRMEAPDDVLDLFCYDTLVHDPKALAYAIGRLGPERVALGTDVPFPMAVDDPAALLDEALALADLEGARREIVEGTPRRLLARVPWTPLHELH